MIILNTQDSIDTLLKRKDVKTITITPVFTDPTKHPCVNSVSVYVLDMETTYVLPLEHNDCQGVSQETIDNVVLWCNNNVECVYTPSKVVLHHALPALRNVIDLKGFEFLTQRTQKKSSDFYPYIMHRMYGKFSRFKNLNTAIPLVKLVQSVRDYVAYLHTFPKDIPGFLFFNDVILSGCSLLEQSGIHVESDLFENFFNEQKRGLIHNGILFAECNPYTTANRVTIRRDGVNYNALNKESGVRKLFTSRYSNGSMVMADFEAFHLRLIANFLNFPLPKESVHEYFAKQYFQTDSPTKEQYEKSKIESFTNLYSDKRDTSIPFFKHISKFIQELWDSARNDGFISTPSGKRITLSLIENPSPAKLFNYLLQSIETETLFSKLVTVGEYLQGLQSKLVLSTYDSVLFDMHPDEQFIVSDIKTILEDDGRYPTRFYIGENYHEMIKI